MQSEQIMVRYVSLMYVSLSMIGVRSKDSHFPDVSVAFGHLHHEEVAEGYYNV